MAHVHTVRDSDAHFPIDPVSRKIRTESSRKNTVIQFDHNSERFTFLVPRHIENHDMSTSNNVEIHYLNIDAKTKAEKRGVYVVDDLAVAPDDSSMVLCSWLISSNATQLVGTLNFVVRFECKENGVVTYSWNTAIATVAVSPGIDGGEFVVAEYADILAKWKEELFAAGYINAATMQDEMATLRSRMDTFTSLKAGSTTGDAELMDIRNGANGTVYENAGTAVREQIKTAKGYAEKISCGSVVTISPTEDQIVHGALITITGGKASTVSWNCTDFLELPFIPLSKIDATCTIHGYAALTFYDSEKNLILGIDGSNISEYGFETNSMKQTVTITLPEGAKYVRLCGCLTYGEYKDISEYKISGAVNFLSDDLQVIKKDLSGIHKAIDLVDSSSKAKKVLVIGDSISADYYGEYPKWVTMLVDEGFFPADTTNSSVHATGFVARYNGGENSFISRIEEIENKENFDLVVIFGGINDYIQGIPMGESGGEKSTHFIPAVEYFFAEIINGFPQARIAVLLPLHTYATWNNSVGHIQEDYSEHIKATAKKYHLPFLNLMDESGFAPEITAFRERWTLKPKGYDSTDGVHPTEEYERRFLAPMIKDFLKKLL